MNRLVVIPVCLFTAALLVSCMLPGTKQLDHPQTDSVELEDFMNPRGLTAESLSTLQALGLHEAFYREPIPVIRDLKARLDAEPSPALRSTLVELCSDAATVFAETDGIQAVAYYLAASELAFQADVGGPALTLDQTVMLAAYNHSAGEVARLLFDAGEVQLNEVEFEGPWRTYSLTAELAESGSIDLGDFDSLVPAAYIKLQHTDVERHRRNGFGAALVGHRSAKPVRDTAMPFMPSTGLAMAVNATLDFSGPDQVILAIHNLSVTDIATLGQETVPLAADFTAPLVMLYDYLEDPNVAWKGMRHPDAYLDTMGLYQTAPFRADRIPVIFSHGLISSPKIWLPSLNTLFSDPIIRSHYQLYLFRYPSGFPIAYSASVMRRWLVDFQNYYDPEHENANFRNLLLIGHSMGGIVSSMQIRDGGDSLSKVLFKRPIDELQGLDEAQKAALKELLIYEANPDIRRVVFLATPHLGSDDASGIRGVLGSKLIDYPSDFLIAEPLTALDELTEYGQELVEARPDGIRALKPNSPLLTAVHAQPVRSGITYHSIIAQKNPKRPLEDSTDGTVAYWSSHLEGAASEEIVFDAHTPMVENKDTIEELRRILYLHVGQALP